MAAGGRRVGRQSSERLCAARSSETAVSAGKPWKSTPRHQVDQCGDREADDVEVVALDAGDEGGAPALDRVAPSTAAPLLGLEVPAREGVVDRAEGDGGGDGGLADPFQVDAGDDLVGAAGESLEHVRGLCFAQWLAVEAPVEGDHGVDAEDQLALDRLRLAAGVLEGDLGGVSFASLLD